VALNNPDNDQSHARKPRVRALVNGTTQTDGKASFSGGTALAGIIDIDLTNNNWYTCDRLNMTLAIAPGSPHTASWWSEQTDVSILLQMGFLPPELPEGDANVTWKTMIQCGADQVAVDPVQGTITVEGRDLSYLLIESRTQEEFNNRTSSSIVTELARRHGLTPVVTATSIPVQRYYASDHTKTTHGVFHRQITEWDLCVFLAQHEDFDLFVLGRELHFQPRAATNPNPWVVRYTPSSSTASQRLNVSSLHMSRSLILAKDIQVEVRSWDSKGNKPVTATSHKVGFGRVSAAGNSRAKGGASAAQNFVYIFPGLTRDQAQRRAEQILKDLSEHERVIDYDEAGHFGISPRSKIRLAGTGTSWDQTYFIDHIRRTLNMSSGFRQSVRAKNMDTASHILTD
jgi:phage protein D